MLFGPETGQPGRRRAPSLGLFGGTRWAGGCEDRGESERTSSSMSEAWKERDAPSSEEQCWGGWSQALPRTQMPC